MTQVAVKPMIEKCAVLTGSSKRGGRTTRALGMCGRFSATFSFRDIKVRWNLYGEVEFAPRYNIAPSQSVPVITKNERGGQFT